MQKLTNKQELELCTIITTSNTINKDVTNYLKEHKLQHSRSTKTEKYKIFGGYIKNLVCELIEKYKLHENHNIKKYPSNVPLTQEEFDVIVGGLLGDTWIGVPKHAKYPCGSFTHKLEHLQYVEYKYNLLKRRCSPVTVHNKYDNRSNRHYQQAFCRISASPVLTDIYKAFYPNKIKVVPKELIYKLSPLGIAIWFMDDGGSDSHGYKFSVDCFTESEIDLLREMLLTKFNIHTTKNLNQNKTIHVISSSIHNFKNLIAPYICDCMKYKLQIYRYINGKMQRVDI